MINAINPKYYKSGDFECIEFTEYMPFCVGNAFKYAWRAGKKGDGRTDLEKCKWYVQRASIVREKSRYEYYRRKLAIERLQGYASSGVCEDWRAMLLYNIIWCNYDVATKIIGDVLGDKQ